MEKINKLKRLILKNNLDGYIVPKNDEFFNEYVPQNRDKLRFISNFSGSFGFALILKNSNYLFVDGRYSLQAKIQSGKSFKIITIPRRLPKDILKNKNLKIGYDPKLHTHKILNYFFRGTKCKFFPLYENLIDNLWIKRKKRNLNFFYKLPYKAIGQSYKSKIKELIKINKKKKIEFSFCNSR